LKFLEKNDLPFQPYDEFNKADLDARQGLYIKLAELIWNPKRLLDDNTA
jgi:hypothetical protein